MSKDIQCPYCDGWLSHDDEQNEPDVTHQRQCRHCEKNFIFYIEYYPSFREHKADCLNGEPHDWEDLRISEYDKEWYEMHRQCKSCDLREYKLAERSAK